MAIYKPSNATPFLDSLDLTKQQDFSCEINTNNNVVVGYRLQILDSKNNVVFAGSEYSPIVVKNSSGEVINKYNNTGLNGSIAILPLSDDVNNKGNYSESAQRNILFLENGRYKSEKSGAEIYNGAQNQPFKWQVRFCQGTEKNGEIVFSDKDFDMTITSGAALGSVPERLQTYFSNNIYSDYYVQLYDKNGNQIGVRSRIKDYDYSYGYIYLQEGSMNESMISSADYISVFKDTNDPTYVTKARLVDYLSNGLNAYYSGHELVRSFSVSDVSKNYFTQIYSGEISTDLITIDRYTSNQGTGRVSYGDNATTFLVIGGDSDWSDYNVYNGVFQLTNVEVTENNSVKQTVFTWMRSTSFATYSNFIDRLICVRSLGKNYQSTANSENLGTINETKLMFFEEQPIGLYPLYQGETKNYYQINNNDFVYVTKQADGTYYGEAIKSVYYSGADNFAIQNIDITFQDGVKATAVPVGGKKYKISISTTYNVDTVYYNAYFSIMETIGKLLKNTVETVGGENIATTYIKPNSSVYTGMRFYYGEDLASNGSDIIEVDNKPNSSNKYTPTWFVKYKVNTSNATSQPLISNSSYIEGTPYAINSMFKIGDENPIYCYDTPDISIFINGEEVMDNNFIVSNRRFEAVGKYSQSNNKQWKKYRWQFENIILNEYTETADKYDGEIKFNAIGLQDGYSYILTLIVEDELGYVVSRTVYIDVVIKDFLSALTINEAALNCDSQSIDIDFNMSGVILPNPDTDVTVSYSNDGMNIVQAKNQTRYNGMLYNKSGILSDKETDKYIEMGIYSNGDNTITLNSRNTITSPYFSGGIIGTTVEIGEYENYSNVRSNAYIYIPEVTTEDWNGNIKANEDRNKIKYKMVLQYLPDDQILKPEDQREWQDIYNKIIKDSYCVGSNGEVFEFYQNNPIIFSMIKEGSTAKDNYDYLYTTVVYDANGNIVEDYVHQIGDKNTSKTNDVLMPGSEKSEIESENTLGYWSDYELKHVEQADGTVINAVSKTKKNVWHDTYIDESGIEHYYKWNDYAKYQTYKQVDVNKNSQHNGRQNMVNKTIAFNMAINGFDPTVKTENQNINVKCFNIESTTQKSRQENK